MYTNTRHPRIANQANARSARDDPRDGEQDGVELDRGAAHEQSPDQEGEAGGAALPAPADTGGGAIEGVGVRALIA